MPSYASKLKPISTGTPSYASKLKPIAAPLGTASTPSAPAPSTPYGAVGSALGNLSEGFAKGAASTAKGLGTLGQTVLDQSAGRVVNAIQGKGFKPTGPDNSVSDIYRPGTPKERQASKFIQPVGGAQNVGYGVEKIAEATGALATGNPSTVLGSAAQTGAISATQAGVTSLGEGTDYKTAAKNAFVASLTGAALGGTSKALGNAAAKFSEKAPTALYNNALKVLNRIKTAGKSPAEFLKDEGLWGALGTFQKAAQEGMGTENAVIKQAALHATGGTTYDDIAEAAAKRLNQSLGDLYSPAEIDQLIKSVPVARLRDAKGVVPWVDADAVRASLGSMIGDSKWLSATPSHNTQAAEALYGALSDAVKKATGTIDNFARLSQWIGTDKVVKRAIGLADSKYGLGLLDAASGTGGAIVGGLAGEGDIGTRLRNAAIGGITGVALERGFNSPALKTGVAQLVQKGAAAPIGALGSVVKGAGSAAASTLLGNREPAQSVEPPTTPAPPPLSPVSSPQSSTLSPERQARVKSALGAAKMIDPTGVVGAAEKAGIKLGATVLSNIHPEDVGLMVRFIDHARIKSSLSSQQFAMVEKLAQHFGVSMDKGISGVANEFEKILTGAREAPGTIPQGRDPLGRFSPPLMGKPLPH